MKIKKLNISADGASSGNPGPAAIGAVIKNGRGETLTRISRSIGQATNNQAEYRALIAALEAAVELDAEEVDIKLDSELLVRQVYGSYRVKAEGLKPLRQRVRELLGKFERFSISHIPDRYNREAHRLAQMALR